MYAYFRILTLKTILNVCIFLNTNIENNIERMLILEY